MPWRIGAERWSKVVRSLDFWFPVCILLALCLLSALKLSGSSLPAYSSSGRVDERAIVSGDPRLIRSDEWLAWSPMKIGRVQNGFASHQSYGMGSADLSNSWRPQLPSRSLGGAIFAPFNLPLVLLPLGQGFAMAWWMPFAACLLGVYAWLRALRVDKGIALAAAVLATSAPAGAWWSGWLCQTIGAATIPAAVLVGAVRLWPHRRGWAAAVAVAAAVAAANLPWWYAPWSIPVAMFVAVVTACWGLADRDRRQAFFPVAAVAGVVFGVEQLAYYVHERSYYVALQNTAYPGRRRDEGGGITIAQVFSSLFPFQLAGDPGKAITRTNLSEISMSWTVFFPFTATVAALGRRAIRRSNEWLMLTGAAVIGAVLTSWCFVQWPSRLGRLTGLTLVPPFRMAPLIGFFWLMTFALLFGTRQRRQALAGELGRVGIAIAVVVTVFIAAWAGNDFRDAYLPAISSLRIWLTVGIIGILFALLWTRARVVALWIAVTLSVVSGILVNPLIEGTGALEDSRAARVVQRIDERQVEPRGGTWAADNTFVNGLLNGQGVNSLSSFNDPVDADGWRVLDPRGRYESAWNRFAYIVFSWNSSLRRPLIRSTSADVVVVEIDPCDRRLGRLELRRVVSSTPLEASCLTEQARFRWQGSQYRIYARR